MRVDYRILGSLEALREGEPLELGGAKQRTVLALLLVNANRLVTTDALTEALWPNKAPGKPLTSIQGYVSHLRKALSSERGSDVIVTESAGYRLAVDSDALDLLRFETLTGKGRTALAHQQPLDAASALTEALALFRGAPLADFGYDDWARVESDRIEELRLACLEDRIEADLALGRHAELVGELEALIAQHPLRERFRGQLMLALYRSGRQAEALDVYQATRTALVEELGLEPGPEIQALHSQILNQDPALAAPDRQAQPTRVVRLPTPASSFIGRERELADVTALVERADVRLVTLTGPGGAGKTRLALEAAMAVADGFRDGPYWISLAPLRSFDRLETTFAQALEVIEQPGIPIADSIVSVFAGKRALIVVDNCEHLGGGVTVLVNRLVQGCPSLVVVASSRERLGLRSERVYAVQPMAPLDGELFFTDRARAVSSGFEPDEHVAAICVAVDQLPLAIELAAARVRSLSTKAIRERLAQQRGLLATSDLDVEERQRTLEATFSWSYDLLASEEQRTLRALSVFAGGCTLDAAQEVAGAELDLIESLLDKSLIRHRIDEADQDRYWMLEMIREHARALLEASGEGDAVIAEHAHWYAEALVERAEELDRASLQAKRWVAEELNNLRAAFSWFAGRKPEEAIRLAAAIGPYFQSVGDYSEELSWSEAALALEQAPSVYLGQVQYRAAMALLQLGDRTKGKPMLEAAMLTAETAGDADGRMRASGTLGWQLIEDGQIDRGIAMSEEAVAHFRKLDRPRILGGILCQYAGALVAAGLPQEAIPLYEEARLIFEQAGLEYGVAIARQGHGYALLILGDDAHALRLNAEALAGFAAHSDRDGVGLSFANIALSLARLGRERDAAMLGAASDSIHAKLGVPMKEESELSMELHTLLEDALATDELERLIAQGRELSYADAVRLGTSVVAGLSVEGVDARPP